MSQNYTASVGISCLHVQRQIACLLAHLIQPRGFIRVKLLKMVTKMNLARGSVTIGTVAAGFIWINTTKLSRRGSCELGTNMISHCEAAHDEQSSIRNKTNVTLEETS